MSAAALDLIEMFDGEGAFVFVDRQPGSLPVFHVQTSADLRSSGVQAAGQSNHGVILALEELRRYPGQLRQTVQRIANDLTLTAAFADTVDMAEYLASEARKIPYTPYISGAGVMMDHLAGNTV
ncbi:uncharacterized protein F5891DRAFT_1196187 [Suillus fuscotomentosus]|uniref:Uncharacterized protein n=1 Tax=Suillus fuscotomentosus TaxID=1912939 RepID=A0AAD4DTA9_9AGAM|nr:uncharacterized protein F5891DRAFT_1196187 [Suillus fuscotomentosus]KAG1893560.1 hypothetical protein F5891DRAFT_1196187 [Suillus fuscotomentosus]